MVVLFGVLWNSDGLLDAVEGNSDGLKGEGAGKLEGLDAFVSENLDNKTFTKLW